MKTLLYYKLKAQGMYKAVSFKNLQSFQNLSQGESISLKTCFWASWADFLISSSINRKVKENTERFMEELHFLLTLRLITLFAEQRVWFGHKIDSFYYWNSIKGFFLSLKSKLLVQEKDWISQNFNLFSLEYFWSQLTSTA